MTSALVLVDLQNDFLPSGALPVPRGDEVIPAANRLLAGLRGAIALATQDWHPPGHGSFATQHAGKRPYDVVDLHGVPQVLWPEHCVQHTYGARFAAALESRRVERVFVKGTDPSVDSYSGFFDNARRRETGLAPWLRQRAVGELVVLGLATDYCVQATVLDGLDLGFRVTVVRDGCRGVDVTQGDSDRALGRMGQAGARIVSSAELLG